MILFSNNKAYDYLLILCCIFSITTLIQSLFPFQINQIIGAILVTILFYFSLKTRIGIMVSLYSFLIILISYFNAENFSLALSESIRFICCILFFIFLSLDKNIIGFQNAVINRLSFVLVSLLVANTIIVISLFLPESYGYTWGNERYFLGYTAHYHTMASNCCLLLSMALVYTKYVRGKWKILFLSPLFIIPSIALLATGARTFLIPLSLMVIFFIKNKVRNVIIRYFLYLISCFIGIYIILISNVAKKFQFTFNNKYAKDNIDSITNGRVEIWILDIEKFKELNIFEKIIGKGFDFTYVFHEYIVGKYIWSHNDFFNLLLCTGLLGLVIYGVTFTMLNKKLMKFCKNNIDKILFLLYMLLPAILNGFYEYQSYVISAIFCFVFLNNIEKCKGEYLKSNIT